MLKARIRKTRSLTLEENRMIKFKKVLLNCSIQSKRFLIQLRNNLGVLRFHSITICQLILHKFKLHMTREAYTLEVMLTQ